MLCHTIKAYLRNLPPSWLLDVKHRSSDRGDCVIVVIPEEKIKVCDVYACPVKSAKRIEIFYEQSGQISAMAIIDDRIMRTAIYFENEAVIVYGQPQALLSSLSASAMRSECVML